MHEKTAGCRGVVGCQALRDLPDADLHLHLLCLELGSDVKLHCGAAVAWPVVPLPLFLSIQWVSCVAPPALASCRMRLYPSLTSAWLFPLQHPPGADKAQLLCPVYNSLSLSRKSADKPCLLSVGIPTWLLCKAPKSKQKGNGSCLGLLE